MSTTLARVTIERSQPLEHRRELVEKRRTNRLTAWSVDAKKYEMMDAGRRTGTRK